MKYLLSLFLCTLFCFTAKSQTLPEPMYPHRLVNDFANIFTDQEKNTLESTLRNYNDTTSTQIYVVTITDLGGYAISDYAFKLGEKWKVGQKNKNNGALILIKPKTENSRGDVFIAVGYGLEAKLNDARIGRLIDSKMLPYFKQDDYYTGVREAVYSMIDYLSGEFKNDQEKQKEGISFMEIIAIIALIILLSTPQGRIILLVILRSLGNGGGGRSGGGFGGGGGGSFGGGGSGRNW